MPDKTVWISTSSTSFPTSGNWSLGAPQTGDDAWFNGRSTANLSTDLSQSAILVANLRQYVSYAKDVGSITTPLTIGATRVELGLPVGDGSNPTPGQVHLALGTDQTEIFVYRTRDTGTTSFEPVTITGTHASNEITVLGSSYVGLATRDPSDTSTFPTINVDGKSAKLRCGAGVTHTTLNIGELGGDVVIRAALPTLSMFAGALTVYGTGAMTTATTMGGIVYHNGTGTITTLNAEGTSRWDFSGSREGITVSNAFLRGKSATIYDPHGRVTWTNGIDLLDGATSAQVNCGTDKTMSYSAL